MQRWYDTSNKEYSVCMGWDAPLQYYFCVVYPYSPNRLKPMDHLYHNLDESDPFSVKTLEPFINLLGKTFNITLPETFIRQLEEDKLTSKHSIVKLKTEPGGLGDLRRIFLKRHT
jgi:hypothetical protein